ncbi:MAG: winged helix DNA-binding domain-containing protein [Actinomycetota bacterium]
MPPTIAERRFHNLGLDRPRFDRADEVVGWLVAVQSQDFGPAKWSVAMRATDLDDAAMDRAFAEGRILRTHVLRPTWHFVLPADIRWLQQLTGPRVRAAMAYYDRQLELDRPELTRCRRVIERALTDTHLTRRDLGAHLARAGVVAEGQRLGHILMHCELDAVICSGVPKGKQQTYALVDQRAPGARTLDDDEALHEFVVRYFRSHGPAGAKDLQAWSSLPATQIRRGIEMAADNLEQETFDGITYLSAGGGRIGKVKAPSAHLLQGYDEYIMGYKETRFWLDVERLAGGAILDRSVPIGMVTIDGQLAGHWKRTVARDALSLEMHLRRKLTTAEKRSLENVANAHARYLGLARATIGYRTIARSSRA